jgi:hypothetical protein
MQKLAYLLPGEYNRTRARSWFSQTSACSFFRPAAIAASTKAPAVTYLAVYDNREYTISAGLSGLAQLHAGLSFSERDNANENRNNL